MDQEVDTKEKEDSQGLRAWYVIHTYSGYENKVKDNLENKMKSQGLENEIFNVVVPVEDETEIKNGKKDTKKRKIFPGYVLVEMIVNNRSWYVVRNTQGVTGFVGSEKDPIPLTSEEVERIMGVMGKESAPLNSTELEVGDTVRICTGVFENYTGKVKEVDREKARVKVLIGERSLDLDFTNVERV